MKKILFLIPLIVGCASQKEMSQYEKLLDYEGKYEYTGNSTLALVASEMDTILYAVIDNAKYPLNYVSVDSFTNIQNVPVTFQRDENGKIKSYKVEGETYAYINSDFEKMEMYPRKELFHNSEAYTYKTPEKRADGLEVGDLKQYLIIPNLFLKWLKKQ